MEKTKISAVLLFVDILTGLHIQNGIKTSGKGQFGSKSSLTFLVHKLNIQQYLNKQVI